MCITCTAPKTSSSSSYPQKRKTAADVRHAHTLLSVDSFPRAFHLVFPSLHNAQRRGGKCARHGKNLGGK